MAFNKSNVFNYVVIFVLGALIASSGFLFWQQTEIRRDLRDAQKDVNTIIQAYNNLITTLQQEGIGKQQ